MARLANRVEAGRLLAEQLAHLRDSDPIVLGLPRGGVPVAFEVAKALEAPLDVIIVRKLGVPRQPELAMGAIGEEGVRVLNPSLIRSAGISEADIDEVERRERAVIEQRARTLRGDRPALRLGGRATILVDDGIATGATTRAAIEVARAHGATNVVLAVPVAPADTLELLRRLADEVVCLATPEPFMAVGAWYQDFTPTTDAEVLELLELAGRPERPHMTGGAGGGS